MIVRIAVTRVAASIVGGTIGLVLSRAFGAAYVPQTIIGARRPVSRTQTSSARPFPSVTARGAPRFSSGAQGGTSSEAGRVKAASFEFNLMDRSNAKVSAAAAGSCIRSAAFSVKDSSVLYFSPIKT